jgi:dTDP-4-amino-4,6-dideoxygalactose transaminase
MIRISQPIIAAEDEDAVLSTLRSGRLVQGPRVLEFEAAIADYIGVNHAVAVSNGTAALQIALLAHDVGPGDEVIVPAFTFAATGNAALLAGATPVLVDIRRDDFTIDASRIEAAISPRTKAIIPVHLYGHPADMNAIESIARQRNLAVIEDAAQAIGASWQDQKVGSFATACFSFYATKNITTGEGGVITTNDAVRAQRMRVLRNQGEEERYRTDILGGNYRITEMQAALGTSQLKKLEQWNKQRRLNAEVLTSHLRGVETPLERPPAKHVYHQYTIRVPAAKRDPLIAALKEDGIEAGVYYRRALHQQPLYMERGIGGSFPVAEEAALQVVSLPVHPALSQKDVEHIARSVNAALERLEAGPESGGLGDVPPTK